MATPRVLVSPRILTDAQWQALYEHARQAPVWSHVFPLRTAVRSTPSFPPLQRHIHTPHNPPDATELAETVDDADNPPFLPPWTVSWRSAASKGQ